MICEGDKFNYFIRHGDVTETVPVKVRDTWGSRHRTPQGDRVLWVELWTYGPDQIERPVAVRMVGFFDLMYVKY
jgi:hypothetical protein